MAAVWSGNPTINPKSAEALGGMIEGRRVERQARERALVNRLGATNKVTKRIKQKIRHGLRWPPKVLHKVLHSTIKQKHACATEKMKEDIRGEGGEKKGDMVHCLGKDQVGRIKKRESDSYTWLS